MNLNATILGQALSFILFVWFCMKYIWPPIIFAIETRQKNIEESLISLKKAEEELIIIQKKMNQIIQDSKEKASFIINEANKKKSIILEDAKSIALEESKKIFLRNQLEIDLKVMQVRKNLHKEIVDLSILIAEKIIKDNIQKDQYKYSIKKLIVSLSKDKKLI
ncbi:F0F1 ATP synthase subunit B [Buchnera aphidicola]|uniref:ATP synthase subunit b n=1 Tax=Buchnera aphidicola subsp. Schizaphis graminum (strain Sg) TaxID=198804 RepID=ATPF_BUCAP|nr:F0F1 ATP synthase subunit B [Buchnera aphidicola]O51876.2 RecName: Full=ATP synthase subunit b; AltName: Full=ATP synthase F(0) sector subunit b; AltName: Full=ATPase subunit I; AltName: Full=F-type ATPase subunit b; Short=F-ATPase subunit b [Buchnera aphidicola str. Sg (Schizaphis graminum)]AAM67576.1 ATP synthase B chain [Buchnera aphidicola str. Sg (Schizaphis graminum)]AWI49920.1 ATP synthase F0 subunit B [Buchnera aphidicola (Schizaphis graminum)]